MTADVSPGMPRLAYLTTSYPSVSHTFIRREIQGLEGMGYTISRIAIRAGTAVDSADTEEEAKTLHLLGRPLVKILGDALQGALRANVKLLKGLTATWRLSRASERGLFKHAAYFVEALALLPHVHRDRIEHVHVHFGTNAATVAMLARLMGGPSYSMTIHGPDELDAPIGFSLGWKMREAAFTVAITHYCSSQLRRWVSYAEWDKIHIVHCSVGPEWFDAASPIDADADAVVCVGRLSGQKGQLLLVDAFADAVARGLDGRLVLVGDGEMRGVIESHISERGLKERIEITGWCDGKEVRRRLLEGRALVLPSFAEGLPVVIMEAMAVQRPVLSTIIMGIPELVRPEEHGWLVVAGDRAALADALLELYATPLERMHRMGAACQERVRERHSTETEVKKLDALFRRYAGGNKS